MNSQTTRTILIGMALGVVLGGIAGYLIPDVMMSIGVIGRLYVNALQILLLPLIVSTIVVGITGLGSTSKLGRATVSALYYFVGTTVIAVLVGLVLAFIMNPGGGVSTAGGFIPDMVARARATTFTSIFSAFIPANLIESISSGQYLGLVVFTLVFAGVLTLVGRKAGLVLDFFHVISDATQRLVDLVLYASPFGLFALVGAVVARNPESLTRVAGGLSWLTVTFVVALLIQGAIVLPLLLRFMGRQPIGSYFSNTGPALVNALGTASSAATLPITYTAVVDVNKVDSRAGSLVLPLGTVMNFNGTAIYLTVAAVFVAQMFQLQFGFIDVVNIAILSVLLSIGTAGVPGAAPFSLAILFSVVGYPVEAYGAIGLLVLVDWLFDRGRAVLNVWGDAVGAAVVGETFEFKTAHAVPGDHAEPRTAHKPAERTTRTRRVTHKSDSRTSSGRTTREVKSRERKPRERTRSRATEQRTPARSKPEGDRGRGRSHQTRQTAARSERAERPKHREPLKPPPLPHEKPAEPAHSQPADREKTPSPTEATAPSPRQQIMEERGRLAAELASFRRESPPGEEAKPETPPEPESTSKASSQQQQDHSGDRHHHRDRGAHPDHGHHPHPTPETPGPAEAPAETDREEKLAESSADQSEQREVERFHLREIPDRTKEPEEVKKEPDQEQPSKPVRDVEAPRETETQPEEAPADQHSEEPEPASERPEPEVSDRSEPEPSEEEATEHESEEQESIHYGRTRHRRGSHPAPGSSDSGDEEHPKPEDETPPPDSFPTENISYGRTRKKRTR